MDDLPNPLRRRANGLRAKIYLSVSNIRKPNLSATELCSLTLWSRSIANRYSFVGLFPLALALARARAFVKKYGIEYPYLIAGAPAEVSEKVPQAVNLNTWPATFFIGHDGLVKKIHAGFAAPASGEFHRQLKEEFTATIERLLAEESASSGHWKH